MPDGTESSQKLPVESAVGDLSAVQLLGEETQQLPWVAWVALLVYGGPHVGGTGVRHQTQLGLSGVVGQLCQCREAVLGQVEGGQHGGGTLDSGWAHWGALQGLCEGGQHLGGAG